MCEDVPERCMTMGTNQAPCALTAQRRRPLLVWYWHLLGNIIIFFKKPSVIRQGEGLQAGTLDLHFLS